MSRAISFAISICLLAATPVYAERTAVIPPGQNELLASILGSGGELPGDCSFANGQAQHETISAVYKCPSGPVVYRLTHPSVAGENAQLSKKFALEVTGGTPPSQLTEALLASIREKESAFAWEWIGEEESALGANNATSLAILLAAAATVAGLIWFALRRMRQQAD